MRQATRWGIAAVLLTALAGCGEKPAEPPAEPVATNGPDNPPGIALSDARVQLPVVSGRPGVAYFTVAQASGAPRSIAGVDVQMAGRAEMHETAGETMKPVASVPVGPGKAVKFEPGGFHAMLFDLDPKLRFAKEVELTVTFDNGDKATARAPVSTLAAAMEQEH